MEILRKICSKCQEEKSLDYFKKQKTGYLGRRADCKECNKNALKIWHELNPDYNKIYRKNNHKIC